MNEKADLSCKMDKLLELGIFKIRGRQLYECSEKEIGQALCAALSNRDRQVN